MLHAEASAGGELRLQVVLSVLPRSTLDVQPRRLELELRAHVADLQHSHSTQVGGPTTVSTVYACVLHDPQRDYGIAL